MKVYVCPRLAGWGGGGVTPYDGLYGEAPPERGTFVRHQVYERVGILLTEIYGRVGKNVFWVMKGPKGLTDKSYGFVK